MASHEPNRRNGDSKARPASGAQKSTGPQPLQSYFRNHIQVSKLSFKEQTDRPVATFLTSSVIGIALVLPTLLLILLSNIQSANLDWDGSAKITLFLAPHISQLEAGTLSQEISRRPDIAASDFIDKDQALKDFKEHFQIEGVIEFLDHNPLPHALIVTPAASISSFEQIEALEQELAKNKAIESTLLDALWVQRLSSITSFLERAVLLIALMLAAAVLLILGNTIRLAIENRKEEIAVLKLVGGTRPFVCRPFLYMGMLYGLGGGIVAAIITQTVLIFLSAPIEELAASYQSRFSLSGLNFESTLTLIVFGTSLGWLGAWLALRRHLDEIEPT